MLAVGSHSRTLILVLIRLGSSFAVEQGDVLSASDLKNHEMNLKSALQMLDKEPSLVCSACELAAVQLELAMDGKLARSFKGWSTAQRVKGFKRRQKHHCASLGQKQIARVGEEGKRKYGDFQEMMSASGSLSNLSLEPETGQKLEAFCQAVNAQAIIDRVEAQMAIKRRRKKPWRLLDFRMRDELCETMLAVCAKPKSEPRGMYDDDDDDDDDDDREL